LTTDLGVTVNTQSATLNGISINSNNITNRPLDAYKWEDETFEINLAKDKLVYSTGEGEVDIAISAQMHQGTTLCTDSLFFFEIN